VPVPGVDAEGSAQARARAPRIASGRGAGMADRRDMIPHATSLGKPANGVGWVRWPHGRGR
jgi:hypothetical protein